MGDLADQASHRGAIALRRPAVLWLGAGLLGLALLVVALSACVLWLPSHLYPALSDASLQGVSVNDRLQRQQDRLKLQNDTRTTLLQGLGALLVLSGAATGAAVALRQVRATHAQIKQTAKDNQAQLELSEQGQFTDRFTKAIDQLDASKGLAVRLGGLYALERIARDSPPDRATIVEVLCAYARSAPRKTISSVMTTDQAATPDGESFPTDAAATERESLSVRAPDIQAAVTILGRWRERLNEAPPRVNLHDADLQGAGFAEAQLQGAYLAGAQLQGAVFFYAKLQDVLLLNAHLQGAFIKWAELQGANMWRAELKGANLTEAHLQRASLMNADLQDAILIEAHLQHADFTHARLERADLTGADLQGANFDTAQLQDANLAKADLQDAYFSGAVLQGANLTGAKLAQAFFCEAKLHGANFAETELKDALFSRAQADEETQWPDGMDRAAAEALGVRYTAAPGPEM